jgi:tRNA(fMet)-specific endonuclease VapC
VSGRRFLLDTEVVVALLRGDGGVRERLGEAGEVFMSVVTLGELRYGALRSSRVEQNVKEIEEFARGIAILRLDEQIAATYATLKNELRSKGRPIPENDLWIAATARQYDLMLVSSDEHFQEIDALPITAW